MQLIQPTGCIMGINYVQSDPRWVRPSPCPYGVYKLRSLARYANHPNRTPLTQRIWGNTELEKGEIAIGLGESQKASYRNGESEPGFERRLWFQQVSPVRRYPTKGKLHKQSSHGGNTWGLRKNHHVFQEGRSTYSAMHGRAAICRAWQKLCTIPRPLGVITRAVL